VDLILRLCINLITTAGVIAIVFNLDAVRKTFVISLAIFNMVIFCLSLIFQSHELSLGSGLGLFALFTLIRYRSEPLRISELSYILICACLGIMNAIFPASSGTWQLIVLNSVLISIVAIMLWLSRDNKVQESYKIRYERLELLRPEYRITLISDLEQRLGRTVENVDIESINYPEHYASLKVYLKIHSIQGSAKTFQIAPDSRREIPSQGLGLSVNSHS